MTTSKQQDGSPEVTPVAAALFAGVIIAVPALTFVVLAALAASIWWYVAGFAVWLSWSCVAVWVELPALRDRQIAAPAQTRRRYRDRIGRLLIALERAVLPATVETKPKPAGIVARLDWFLTPPLARDADDLKRLARNPLSWPVHDLALRIAIAYPILFALGQFVATGRAVTFADYPMVPADTPYWWATATFGVIVAAILARIMATATSKGVYEELSTWLFIGAFAVAFAVAVAGAVAGAGAIAGAVPGAVAVAVAVAVPGAVAVAFAFAVAGAGAFAGAFAVAWRARAGHGQSAYLLFHLAALAAALAAAILVPAGAPAAAWIPAVAVLPLVNAGFDWLSYGITLWLVGIGHRWDGAWRLLFSLFDIAAAAMLFFALSFALVGTLVLIEAWRGEPLLDPRALLEGIRAGDLADNAWVIAMVASTLVPTLVHLAIGFFSLMTLIRGALWRWLVENITLERGLGPALLATLGFTLLRLGFLLVPSALLLATLWGIWTYGGALATTYADRLIRICEGLGWL